MNTLSTPTNNTTRNWLIAGFLVIYIISVLIHLNYFPLNGDEPRRAIISIEMMHSGNFIHPTTMGWEYYNKPPIYNWFIAGCMYLTGSTSEIPVRLPALISLVIWAFCNYQIVKRLLNPRIALYSSLFLLTSFDIYFWFLINGGEIDVFYSLVVYLQVMSLFYFSQQKKWLTMFVVSYAFAAIGFLTKGFPSILFEGFTLIALCVYYRSARIIFRWQHLAGIATFAILLGGFLYAYSFYGNAYNLITDLLKESFNKSAFGEFQEKLGKKVVSYPLSFLKILLPWTLLLLFLLKKHRFRLWSNPVIRFCFFFFIFNIPVYWFTGHPRMRYVYMFVPFAMIILAYIFYYTREEHREWVNSILKKLPIVFVLILAATIAAPFWLNLQIQWVIIAAVVLIGYLILFRRANRYGLAYFGFGIVVLRLVYALLFIPVRAEKTELRYDREMAEMARLNNYQPISIYRPAEPLPLVIDLKFAELDFGTIPSIPYMAYQMPYYYYRASGHVVKYDTIIQPGRNYVGFRSTLTGLNTNVMHSFFDHNQNDDDVVLFNLAAPPNTD